MESNQLLDNNFASELGITSESKEYLAEASKWARFLGIIGFIVCALMVLMGFMFPSLMMGNSAELGMEIDPAMTAGITTMTGIMMSIFSLLYLFPSLYLFRFGSRTKTALAANDTELLTDALKNLKSFFKFMGILMVITIAFYIVAIVIGILMPEPSF